MPTLDHPQVRSVESPARRQATRTPARTVDAMAAGKVVAPFVPAFEHRLDAIAIKPGTGRPPSPASTDHSWSTDSWSTVGSVLAGPGRPLDAEVRAVVEPRFGRTFDRIRIHTDRDAATSARALDAEAWTLGDHIAFGSGRFDPGSRGGLWLLAHELAHVVQQGGAAPSDRYRLAPSADPADRAADRAADAVLAARPVPDQPRSTAIQRQRITSVDRVNKDEKVAHLDNGTRIRVRRYRRLTTDTERVGGVRVTPGVDRQRAWLELDWCAAQSQGSVRVGANVPEQVLKTILKTVTSGGDIDGALRGIDITPYAETTVNASDFQITAHGEVTVDRSGTVTGGQGRIGVSHGPVDVAVQGGASQTGGVQGGVVITVTPGRQTTTQDCRREQVRLYERRDFECSTERDVAPTRVAESVRVQDERRRFVYFEYARDALAPRSTTTTAELAGDLHDGFQVNGIRGFTSPEGPTARGRRFMGNDELARRRAAAAARVVEAACRADGGTDQDACFVGGRGAVSPTGAGELYSLVQVGAGGATQEVEGAPLAEHAAGEFLAQGAEEGHRTPEMEARLRDPATTSAERADLVYPLLRRAEITLVRTRTETRQREVPGRTENTPSTCSDEVIDQLFPRAMEGLGA